MPEGHSEVVITSSHHAYRKAFTSRQIDANMNLLTVQQFTRHRSLDILKVYYDRRDLEKKLPLFEAAVRS